MSKLGNIKFNVDTFFTNTRMRLCKKIDCEYNLHSIGELNCNLKLIEIGNNGECLQYKKRSVENANKKNE